jgi:hypothetical protein
MGQTRRRRARGGRREGERKWSIAVLAVLENGRLAQYCQINQKSACVGVCSKMTAEHAENR